MLIVIRRQTPRTAAEQVTSVIPRDRPRSHIVPQPGNLALPIQTTVTPRKRPSASNPQTPVTGTAVDLKFSTSFVCVSCLQRISCTVWN